MCGEQLEGAAGASQLTCGSCGGGVGASGSCGLSARETSVRVPERESKLRWSCEGDAVRIVAAVVMDVEVNDGNLREWMTRMAFSSLAMLYGEDGGEQRAQEQVPPL